MYLANLSTPPPPNLGKILEILSAAGFCWGWSALCPAWTWILCPPELWTWRDCRRKTEYPLQKTGNSNPAKRKETHPWFSLDCQNRKNQELILQLTEATRRGCWPYQKMKSWRPSPTTWSIVDYFSALSRKSVKIRYFVWFGEDTY